MEDKLIILAGVLLGPQVKVSTKKDFLSALSQGICLSPSLATQSLTDLVAECLKDQWWGVRESATWTLRTILSVRPDLAHPGIIEIVHGASNGISDSKPRESVDEVARNVLELIAKIRPDLPSATRPEQSSPGSNPLSQGKDGPS
jgi:hypothetical protein